MASMPISFAALLDRPDIWRGQVLSRAGAPTLPCGFPGLDAELPGGGWPAGALTEILPAHEGIGELRLLGPALAGLSRREIRGAEAPANRCRGRPRTCFSVPGPGGCERVFSRPAADRARHERRRPCGTRAQAPRCPPRSAHPAAVDAARRARQKPSCGSPSGCLSCRSRFFCAARPRLSLSRSKSGTAFLSATARHSRAAFAPAWL